MGAATMALSFKGRTLRRNAGGRGVGDVEEDGVREVLESEGRV